MRPVVLYLTVFAFFSATGVTAPAGEWTMQLELGGRRIEGTPLNWNQHEVALLARDGFIWNFAPSQASNFRKISARFRSYSPAEMRGMLLREFGQNFDVSGTGHYLVVHPRGQRDRWAHRFEDLYRSFTHYFTARGLRPQPPRFPLVAVVFPTHQAFLGYARNSGEPVNPRVLGYYSAVTNRILLYDVTAGGNQDDWHVNAETIIHEATHQTAFNTGIHNRFHTPPRWVIEGLGTMFEARGVWNCQVYTSRSDRVNGDLLRRFQAYAPRRKQGALANFLASDRLFASDPHAAYAEAWALSFFLSETRPRQYTQYLRKTADSRSASSQNGPQRLKEFSEVFGTNLAVLEAHFLSFLQQQH